MLNFLKFKGPAEQAYYSAEVIDSFKEIAQRVEAEILYASAAGSEFIRGDAWDFVDLIRYQTTRP